MDKEGCRSRGLPTLYPQTPNAGELCQGRGGSCRCYSGLPGQWSSLPLFGQFGAWTLPGVERVGTGSLKMAEAGQLLLGDQDSGGPPGSQVRGGPRALDLAS